MNKILYLAKVVRQMPYGNRSIISDFWKPEEVDLETGEPCLLLTPTGDRIDLSWAEGYIAKLMEVFKIYDSTEFFIIDLRIGASNWKGVSDGESVLSGLPLALVSSFRPGIRVHPRIVFISNFVPFRKWLSENIPDSPNFNSYVVSPLGKSAKEIGEGVVEWLKLNISAISANRGGELGGCDVFQNFRDNYEAPEFLEVDSDPELEDFELPDEEEEEDSGFQKIKRKHPPRR